MSPSTSDARVAPLPGVPVGAHLASLRIRTSTGRRLLGPVSMDIPAAALTVIVGATPAGRWSLACAITGTLPTPRLSTLGELEVGGLTSPPLIHSLTKLAQSWRVRDTSGAVNRRLAALTWGATHHGRLIVLCPGLDGLTPDERYDVLNAARAIVDTGATVVVTAWSVTAAERALADATIDLDAQMW